MGMISFVTGLALIDEVRRSRVKILDPFGEEASGAETFAANFLRDMDPLREEAVIEHLSGEQPEALNALRSGRILFNDLPRHNSRVVREALADFSSAELALAMEGKCESAAFVRRKILSSMELKYVQMGISDFSIPLRT
jgi:flagellar motor switch protein FliG